ncbi:Ras-related protein Rab-10 [Clonorchis sinensis]|uniref:Ras-related protein Rab-10 n=1 Tax=Clonorchis sinensis TaxID=79923 RepID=G7YTV8_CLOSI|nr:Ras-related protein Rab-10 [Clonorchis sinensis]
MAHNFGQHDDLGEMQPFSVTGVGRSTGKPPTAPNGTTNKKSKSAPKSSTIFSPSNDISGGTGEERFDARFKVLLLGNSGVGKTSILRTLMGEKFNPGTISTIGIDLAKKLFIVENHRIQLEIWDTAGQEQYHSIVAFHFRGAKAFIVMYDVTQPKTFEQIRKYWLRSVDDYMDEPIPVFFAANKADLESSRVISKQDGEKLASQQCAHGFFETSAKTGLNVQNLFQRVAESMVSTWGAPKRWYEMDQNGNTGSAWPNQEREGPPAQPTAPSRQTIQLTFDEEQPVKSTCCLKK